MLKWHECGDERAYCAWFAVKKKARVADVARKGETKRRVLASIVDVGVVFGTQSSGVFEGQLCDDLVGLFADVSFDWRVFVMLSLVVDR